MAEKTFVKDFVGFLNRSPSQFHAVAEISKLLKDGGFQRISEKKADDFSGIRPGGKYFFTRNQSMLVAFAVGGKYKTGNGFSITAGHTDSPVLKVKPVSKVSKCGYQQVGVECYGGGLWNTWFDRDLSVAGRAIVKTSSGFESKLVCIDKSVMHIPNLASHLNRGIYSDGFKYNKETHTCPILATEEKAKAACTHGADADAVDPAVKRLKTAVDAHHPLLLEMVADKLECKVADIQDFELCLYNTQPAQVGGACDEFIYARGLDNLGMSYICTRALIDASATAKDLADEEQIRMVALFDNEEVGSVSVAGANSNLLLSTLQRINNDAATLPGAIRQSFLVSADMAHGIHPNYAEKHERNHAPLIHRGLVIKQNANQRYATNSITTFLIEEIGRRHDLPVQKFVVRNDSGCGSTIGPALSSLCGIRTIDVGNAMLSMHSIRETCGTTDTYTSYELFKHFYNEFRQLDLSLKIGDE